MKRTRPGVFRGRQVGPQPRRALVAAARLSGEMKYFDCELASNAVPAVTTTWVATTMQDPGTTIDLGSAAVATPLCLFAPIVAAGLNGRIGRSVKVLKIKVRGTIAVPAQTAQTGADPPMQVRLMLVMDKQTNAAQMTGAQLMRDASATAVTINSFQNPNNFGRFQVLKDKSIAIQNPNTASLSATNATFEQQGFIIPFKMNWNFKVPCEVRFNATNGGTVADIIDNSFHMVAGATTLGFAPALSYYSRISFKE